MKPLFEMPELLTLNGETFVGLGFTTGSGGGCVAGCDTGCSSGCEKGGGPGNTPVI